MRVNRFIGRASTAFLGVAAGVVLAGCCPKGDLPAVGPPTTRPSSPTRVRVAGIVLKWLKADKERNYKRAEPLIREAAAKGAQIVITTECFLDGYAIRDKAMPINAWLRLAEAVPDGPYVRRLCALADELNVHLVAGLVERSGQTTYNTAILIGPDGHMVGRYHKRSLGHEVPRNTPGTDSPVFDTPYGLIGLIICADRREPDVVRQIAAKGTVMILCPSGGMWGAVTNDFHLQDRSRENRVPIVFVHPCEFLVTGPDGDILDRRFVGRELEIPAHLVGSEEDSHLVAVFDVTLGDATKQRVRP